MPVSKTFTIKLPTIGSVWRHRARETWCKVYSIWSDRKGEVMISYFITDHDGNITESGVGVDSKVKRFFKEYRAR